MVSKDILNQYIDLKEEYKELNGRIQTLEKQINKIEKEGEVVDKVMGGDGGIQSFRIEGFPYPEYSRKQTLLNARKAILSELELEILENVNQVEKFISEIQDSHIRRIISFRFIDGLTWNEVADKMSGNNTEDSVKKAFQRFMEK